MEYNKESEVKDEDKQNRITIQNLLTMDKNLLKVIMTLFGPQDLLSINQVAKSLYNLSNDPKLWNKYGYNSKEEYVHSIEKFLTIIQDLKEQDKPIQIALYCRDEENAKEMKVKFFHGLRPVESQFDRGKVKDLSDSVKNKVGDYTFVVQDTNVSKRFAAIITEPILKKANVLLVFVKDQEQLNSTQQDFESKSRTKGTELPLIIFVASNESNIEHLSTPTSQIITVDTTGNKINNPTEVLEEVQQRLDNMTEKMDLMKNAKPETKGFFK